MLKQILHSSKAFWFLLLFVSIVFTLVFHWFSGRGSIGSDGIGYYSVLPAIFIDQDLTFNKRVEVYEEYFGIAPENVKECDTQHPTCNEYLSFTLKPDGNWYIKYPVGVAILQLPFFVIADTITQISGGVRNGISPIYQYAIAIAAICYFIFALYFVYKILRKRFTKNLSIFLIVFLILGTNILHYAIYEPSMSHIYSFALICVSVYLLDCYIAQQKRNVLVCLGITLSLISLVRNFNFIFALIPLFVILLMTKSSQRIRLFLTIAILWGATFFLVFIPQFLYWKITMGSFVVYGYGKEYFDFLNPHIYGFLFQLETNGLFFWHPLLLLAIPGFYYWLKSKDKMAAPSIVFLCVTTYILSCWWGYSSGYSFGQRVFTDFLLLLIIPIGFLLSKLQKMRGRRWGIARGFLLFVILLFCLLNLIQMNNYWRGVVASHNLTSENYWRNFARPYIGFDRR